MSDQANVKSSDAIQSVRAALLVFAKQAEEGLTEIDAELRRMVDWLEHNRPGFWEEQHRRAWDGVTEAKQELNRCLMFPVGVNERPSCSEQRAALKKAQAKLKYCEEKREKLQHWIREARHEMHTYQGRTSKLREVIETDAPAAAALLGRLLTTLEQYARSGSPMTPAAGSNASGTNEPVPDESTTDADPSPDGAD